MARAVVAVLSSVLVASCTGGSPTSTTPTATEADVVAWLDQVCGAVAGTASGLSTEPSIDLSDPAKLKAGLSDWLSIQLAAAEKSAGELEPLENGPHPKAGELVGAAENGVGQIRTLLSDTKSKVDSAPDATAVITAFTEMMTKAAAVENTGADVRRKVDESGLAEAAKKAGKCRELDPSTSSQPTS
ncbi:hypothetical protein BBK82_12725 [Lentzea guizhouensis]|uniref:Small secreted protein n=2 Tax=Lentzea guizhouensis TaxID=1586287 RepID=A0A1B2HGG2_9PSEU|nr:hypothetical protein BBK82_12725 [Lentzea guizhouensis]